MLSNQPGALVLIQKELRKLAIPIAIIVRPIFSTAPSAVTTENKIGSRSTQANKDIATPA